MLFNSVDFLFFFPIVAFIYFLIPHKIKWIWLLFASYYFYMSWNPKYALLMGLSTVVTYLSGLLISWTRKQAGRLTHTKIKVLCKTWVFLSFFLNLSVLFFYKYFAFAISNINAALSTFGISTLDISFSLILPVGISFYTFQALSYTADVYSGDIEAEKNLGKYALFVSFFPQLVAGPIERSENLLTQISDTHRFDYNNAKYGLQLMLWGLFQKLAIADRLSPIVDNVYNNYDQSTGIQIIFATMLFAIQIYCDFAGYSNIAIGASQVMGFNLIQNFDTPYFATSIKDFWKRWHISLSTWFRDYLYIPLGGNRCSTVRKYANLMITFLVSGLWHGASWNYVIWGGLHGAYQIIGEILKPARQKCIRLLNIDTESFSHKFLQRCITFTLVCIAWVFFRAPSATKAFDIISQAARNINILSIRTDIQSLGIGTIEVLAILCLLMVSLANSHAFSVRKFIERQDTWFRWLLYWIETVVVCYYFILQNGGFQGAVQFIYFQF
ncbi:MAG: MBOAT family O-acyltransferase [Hydrogenoanaerobacterium sp.]